MADDRYRDDYDDDLDHDVGSDHDRHFDPVDGDGDGHGPRRTRRGRHDLDPADLVDPDTTGLPNPYAVPEVEDLLEEAIETLAEARPLPMSTTVKVNRDELLHLLERAQESLPEELRAARWLLKERDDFVARARQEHQDLIDEGRAQVGRMVERQEIVKAAELRARQIVDEAREEASTLKRQVEDYCDQRLANFEQALTRTVATVQKGRERLMATAKANTEEIMAAAGSGRMDVDIDPTESRSARGNGAGSGRGGRAGRRDDDRDLAERER